MKNFTQQNFSLLGWSVVTKILFHNLVYDTGTVLWFSAFAGVLLNGLSSEVYFIYTLNLSSHFT